MIDEIRPQQEIDLFRAVTIREIEERSEMNCTDTPQDLYNCYLGRFGYGLFDSWSPYKSGSD